MMRVRCLDTVESLMTDRSLRSRLGNAAFAQRDMCYRAGVPSGSVGSGLADWVARGAKATGQEACPTR